MANKVLVTKSKLDLLADSVSAKSGVSLPLTIAEMKIAVDGIQLNTQIIGDGDLEVDENDYLYFDEDGEIVLGTKTITQNGTYSASSDNLSGYSLVTVNVAGSGSPTLQAKTNITPTESSQTITADSGYDGLSSVQINAVSSTYVGSGIDRRDETDLTASGSTVTVPAGFYAEQETKSIASGTAGTPTATKGSVSNHSISVTPSVTNTTGYITGGTNTGTAVTVSASELVSGTLSITSSGTKDVTNYASASVAAGTEGTPTATKGTVSNHQITVTPSVTNTTGYIEGGTKTGTAVTVSASELVSGTLNVSSSGTKDVTNYAAASIPAGTEGIPTATKGTASNHSISITPSVTNSAGYITGSTKTGTAVTVTASELASGNKEITQNGTNIDVVGYSTVSVAVPSSSTAIITDTTDTAGGTIRTITTTDEVHLQTKTITPTSTQQTVLPDTGYDGFSSVIVGASSGDGSSNYTRTTIATEQIVTPTSTTSDGNTYYSAQLNLTSGLESGEEYIITYNGIEYFYTCRVLWGNTYLLGEINYFYGTTGLPYPFGILWTSGNTCRMACGDSTGVTVKIEKLEFVEDSSTPSATAHTIYFEFSDGTDTTITAYYDDSFISNAITATTPTTYGQKTVTLAQLDGVTWYPPQGTWQTIFNNSVYTYPDGGFNINDVTLPLFGADERWRVTYFDGSVYECTTASTGSEYYIGNLDLTDTTGLPFNIVGYTWGTVGHARVDISEPTFFTIKLEKYVTA